MIFQQNMGGPYQIFNKSLVFLREILKKEGKPSGTLEEEFLRTLP